MKKLTRRQLLLAISTLLVIIVLIFAMTSAWYTNVSKTSSALRFKTEIWGFDDSKISISDSIIAAAPGTGGIVAFSADNSEKSESVRLSVTVSKATMSDDYKNRIFFYADKSYTKNGETVGRSYIGAGSYDSFEYILLPGQKLIVGDDYYNDTPIKWEWVYDMTGYYFRGTVGTGGATYEDYLRPIEYDYEKAVYDGNGKLQSVDGMTTAEFLADLSAHDGYEGTINPNVPSIGSKTYYPVDVDLSGYGVWAYLCTWSEIEAGIAKDTELAQSSNNIEAKMNITASNIPLTVGTASGESGLRTAAADPDTDVVSLSGDVTLSSPLTVSTGDVTLNLNGHELRYSGSESNYSMFEVGEGANLTVIGGSIKGNGQTGSGAVAFDCTSADVTLSHVNVSGFGTAVYADDESGNPDSVIKIYDCDFNTAATSVMLRGNGEGTPTKLIISGSNIVSGYIGLAGNGNSENWNTETVITDSTIKGYWAALYLPQSDSDTVVRNSTCEGYTGIAAKGGTLTIIDSTVKGTGAHNDPAANTNGWTDTGDGVYVESVYSWNTAVYIKGTSVITSDDSYAVGLFGASGAGVGSIVIEDGTYTGQLGAAYWNGIGSFRITGGTLNGYVSDTITDRP